jgi:CubicO group peptidase (beta-lactamase class C family)
MNRRLFLALGLLLVVVARAADLYYPPRGEWATIEPADAGFDPEKLAAAIAYSTGHEYAGPRDLAADLRATFGKREPLHRILGPVSPRGDLTGLVIRQGKLVAAWGEPDRADMTFSVAKTFLSTVVGVAWDRRLIRNLDEPVARSVPDPTLFADPHNAPITWDHLLRQTSDWSGTLWDIPDWADRPVGATPADHPNRPRYAPGTYFKYNDVRVNLLALCALHVWREPLPVVLRREIMDPIGASSTWRWHGYENSWVTIDGLRVQSVSGGGHFGGGLFINAWDLARFGLLHLRNGRWNERQLLSSDWIQLARTPGPANAEYGFMNWYLNPDAKIRPGTPATSVCFVGNGRNIVYVDWENDLVVVIRWIKDDEAAYEFLARVVAALKTEGS